MTFLKINNFKIYSKVILFTLTILFLNSCNNYSRETISDENVSKDNFNSKLNYPLLGVNKNISQSSLNVKILNRLQIFLELKDSIPRSFEHWKESDFEKYMFPYNDLMYFEKSNYVEGYFYKPTVIEILKLEKEEHERLIKIAFIGNENGENFLKGIYNIIIDTDDFKFKRILEHNTKNWKSYDIGNIQYFNSPLRQFDFQKAETFNELNNTLAAFFDRTPRKITYYACTTPKELFEIMGYDYISNMYMANTGALNETTSNIIFAGNNSETYPHELVHSYMSPKYFKTINNLRVLGEGFASYIGGSNGKPYEILREDLKILISKKDIDFSEYLDPYYETQKKNELANTIGALICERAIRLKGVQKFMEIFEKENLESSLKFIDLNLKNLDRELKTELERPQILSLSILDN
jgi:hypothetical protein